MDKFCTHFILHAAFCRCAPAFSHLFCGGAKNILPVLRGIVCTAAFCRCTRTFPFDCCVLFCGSNTTFCQCTAAFCIFAHADFCVSFMRGRYNSASAAFLIVVFRSAAALERSATPRHRLRCSVLPAFLHPPYAGALCELSPSICLFGDNSHSPYCGAKRSASILHVCKSTKNKPFLIVVCDSVSVAKFFTLQPCVNVLRQIRDSITLVSSPIFLFCAADSRTHRPPPPLNCHASCRRRAATIAAATAALLPSLLCFHCCRAATAATAATAAAVAFVFVEVVVSAC